jgi:NAD(P)-dependent dehydrogenase (short-subunit alcohol dehydrogenase family)
MTGLRQRLSASAKSRSAKWKVDRWMVARRARSLAREPRDHLKERCPRCHRHGLGPGKLLARHLKTLLATLGVFTDLVAGEAERMLVALVAGATRGAGRAIAVELARAGFFVYATGRSSRATGASELGRPETIEETGDLIHAAGGEGAVRVVDHENPGQVAALVAAIDDERGRLDVLVNDIFGGDRYMQWDKPLWEHDWQGGLRMLQMGVHTHLITCRSAIPLMLRAAASHGTRGLVVEMTDGTAQANAEFRRNVGFYYDLVKANVERIVKGITAELENLPITAVGVTPGWHRRAQARARARRPERTAAGLPGLLPVGHHPQGR